MRGNAVGFRVVRELSLLRSFLVSCEAGPGFTSLADPVESALRPVMVNCTETLSDEAGLPGLCL